MILPFCNRTFWNITAFSLFCILIQKPYTFFYGKLSTFLFRKLFHYSLFMFTHSTPPPFARGYFTVILALYFYIWEKMLSLFSRKLFSRVLYISPGGRSFIYSQAPYLLFTELFIYFHFMNGGKKRMNLSQKEKLW